MKTIDRYIFTEWLKAFGLSLGVMLGLLLIEDMYDDLSDLLDFGIGAMDVVRYYVILLPSFLPAVLPLALMISILFCLSTLHRNNEITALRSCGLTITRITRSIWVMGILLSGLLLYLHAKLVPWSVEQSRTIFNNFAFAHELTEHEEEEEVGLIFTLTFYNHEDRRLWFMNRFSEYTFQGFGVTVNLLDENGQETKRLLANEAYFDDEEKHWVFLQGREISFKPGTNEIVRSLAFDEKKLPEFREEPVLMQALEKRPKDLSLFELASILKKLPESDPRINAYLVRYHGILANPLSCLIVVGIAVSFAVSGVRVNPMVGVSKSMGLFFAYYLAESIFSLLGGRELLDPVIAAWIPNGIMFMVALWFYHKAD